MSAMLYKTQERSLLTRVPIDGGHKENEYIHIHIHGGQYKLELSQRRMHFIRVLFSHFNLSQTPLTCLMDTDGQETFPNALHSMISSNAIRLDSLVW